MERTLAGESVHRDTRITRAYMGVRERTGLANNEVLKTCICESRGILIVADVTNQKVILLRIEGSTIAFVSGNPIFTITKDTARKINVYWETGQVEVQNNTGATLAIKVGLLRI